MTRTAATCPRHWSVGRRPTAAGRSLGRTDLIGLADRILAAARRHTSATGALVMFPGAVGGYGRRVDGLEGFARTFLLAGFRIAGDRGRGHDELLEAYAGGLAAGTDPSSPEGWVRLTEHPQAKVEAASVALALDLTRPWLWDHLPGLVRERVVDYLAPAVGDPTYPQINWVWFRLVVETFLRSVGGPWSPADIAEDLATHDSFLREGGWLSDGPERAYDHYVAWALHLYPTLWARMGGAAEDAAPRRDRDVARLDRFLQDAIALVGADGGPLIQGRSLVYRFAAAAPFFAGALAGVPSLRPGQLRRAATGIVAHFVDHGVPDEDDLLTLGWYRPWPRLAQAYSGPGSPYWAVHGLLGIALPATHPVWSEPEEPLPVERGQVLRAVGAPGWLVSGTRADGIVRVVNHGTDHAVEGADVADSPLYARFGYSTATSPLLDRRAWQDPIEQSVSLVDAEQGATHRAGMRPLAVRVQDDADGRLGVAASRASAHWVLPDDHQTDHGSGWTGRATPAGVLTTVSLVRGPWELRLVHVDSLAVDRPLEVRIGGWAIADDRPPAIRATDSGVAVGCARLISRLDVMVGAGMPECATREDASPLGRHAAVPCARFPARTGAWVGVLIELSGVRAEPADGSRPAAIALSADAVASVTWPDGAKTVTPLPIHSERSAPDPR